MSKIILKCYIQFSSNVDGSLERKENIYHPSISNKKNLLHIAITIILSIISQHLPNNEYQTFSESACSKFNDQIRNMPTKKRKKSTLGHNNQSLKKNNYQFQEHYASHYQLTIMVRAPDSRSKVYIRNRIQEMGEVA